jgi:predicted ATPase
VGQENEAIEVIRQGLASYRATGTELLRPHFLVLLAEAMKKAGRIEEGLEVLEEALEQIQRNGDQYYLAEVYRLKGELLLLSSIGKHEAAGAERCLNQAIETARKQKAKSLELRAAMSLSRLYQSRKQKEKAKKLLAPVYGSFTEGLDTKDLREAKLLLQELA